jgi:hypothetical protein
MELAYRIEQITGQGWQTFCLRSAKFTSVSPYK